MKITLTERFQRDMTSLSAEEKKQLFSVLLEIPKVMGEPHRHQGIGMRKLHHSGIYEARIGLKLRMVFALQERTLISRNAQAVTARPVKERTPSRRC